jgi:hypothetical protein
MSTVRVYGSRSCAAHARSGRAAVVCDDPRVFVPEGFEPPAGPVTEHFVIEPLGPQHNERDYEAWSSSIEHIRATPDSRTAAGPAR